MFTHEDTEERLQVKEPENDLTRGCELERSTVTGSEDGHTITSCGYFKNISIPVSLWGVVLSVDQAVQWDVSAGCFGEG